MNLVSLLLPELILIAVAMGLFLLGLSDKASSRPPGASAVALARSSLYLRSSSSARGTASRSSIPRWAMSPTIHNRTMARCAWRRSRSTSS